MSRTTQVKMHLQALILEVARHTQIHLGFHLQGIWRAITK